MNRRLILILGLCFVAFSLSRSASADPFDDIQFWTGSGENRAGLVIDWYDGITTRSFVWGYRWDGSANGLDLLNAVVAADSRLFTHIGEFSWGTAILGLGYDLNHDARFGVSPSLTFDETGMIVEQGADNANDNRSATYPSDLFLEGWNSGFWGFYLKSSPMESWVSSQTGAGGQLLSDGSYYGFRFAPGFASQAPAAPTPAAANPFGFSVVASNGPFGAELYNDPASLLGQPTTDFFDPFSSGTKERRVKIVEPPFNLDVTQTDKLITTLNQGSSITVQFEQPIFDDPGNPYGIDLLVFGNAFYAAAGAVNESNLDSVNLAGGGFFEPLKVSVSPGYAGAEGQIAGEPSTWDWYLYDDGPYADTGFPTQAYHWDRENSRWSDQMMDFTKPVNPVFAAEFEQGGMSIADAIGLYDGSGGGTGFDLAPSGFDSIQYVRVEGMSGFSGGEVDAIAAVRPAVLGESLTVAPANLTSGSSIRRFQHPTMPGLKAVELEFSALNEPIRVSTKDISMSDILPSNAGLVHVASDIELAPLLGVDEISYEFDLHLGVGRGYNGDGEDLAILQKDADQWEFVSSEFDQAAGTITLAGVTSISDIALVQAKPKMSISSETNDSGEPVVAIRFGVIPGFQYSVLRSNTIDFSQAEEIAHISPTAIQSTEFFDAISEESGFYHVRLNKTTSSD